MTSPKPIFGLSSSILFEALDNETEVLARALSSPPLPKLSAGNERKEAPSSGDVPITQNFGDCHQFETLALPWIDKNTDSPSS